VTGVAEITGLDKDYQPELKDVFLFKQSGIDANGKVLGDYVPTGYIPKCYQDFVTQGIVLDKNIFSK
jgi:pilus assembly protein CpaF